MSEESSDQRTKETGWKDIHVCAFTKWSNNVLCEGGHTKYQIESLKTDLKDGIKLIKLLQCLWPDKAENFTYSEEPNCELKNLESFLGYLKEAGVKCVDIGRCVLILVYMYPG